MSPCPRGQEIYNLSRIFLGYYYNILNLSELCLGVEKKIIKEIMHFHYMYMTYSTRTPAPGVMKFTILVDPSLVITAMN